MINRDHAVYGAHSQGEARRTPETFYQVPASSKSSLSKIIIVGTLTVLIYALPWIFTVLTEEYYEIAKNSLLLIGIAVLVMVWGVTTIIKKRVSVYKTPIDLAMVAIISVAILSTIFAINQDTSVWGYHMRMTGGLISYILLASIFYLVINNINNKETAKFLVRSTVYSLAIVALFTVLKSLGMLDFIFKPLSEANAQLAFLRSPLFTPTGNPNALTFLFVTGLPLSLFMFVNKKAATTKETIIGIVTAILFVLGAAFTSLTSTQDTIRIFTWVLIAGIVIAAMFFVYSNNSNTTKQSRLIINAAILLVVVFGALFTFDNKLREGVNNSLTKMNLTYNFSRYYDIPATTSSKVITDTYSKYGVQSMIFGTGLDTYAYLFPQFRPSEQNLQINWFENYTRSNTQIESLLTNSGLIGGLLAFGSLAFLMLKFVIQKIIKDKEASQSRTLFGMGLVMIVFVASFFLVYHSVTLLFFFWLLTALGFKLYMFDFPEQTDRLEAQFKLVNRGEPSKSLSLAPYLFTIIVAGIGITIVFLVTTNFIAETHYSSGLKLASANSYDEAYDKYVAAVSLNGNRDYYHREIASVALSKLDAILTPSATEEKKTEEEKQQQETAANYLLTLINAEVNKAIMLNPENHENWQRAAVIYKRLTELAQGKQFGNETLQAITQAISKNPTNPDNYLLLGYIYQFNSDETLRQEAEKAYLKAYDLQPSYALSIIQLGGYLEYVNKYNDALALYTVSKEKIFNTESAINKFLTERIEAMQQKINDTKNTTPTNTAPKVTVTPTPVPTQIPGNQ